MVEKSCNKPSEIISNPAHPNDLRISRTEELRRGLIALQFQDAVVDRAWARAPRPEWLGHRDIFNSELGIRLWIWPTTTLFYVCILQFRRLVYCQTWVSMGSWLPSIGRYSPRYRKLEKAIHFHLSYPLCAALLQIEPPSESLRTFVSLPTKILWNAVPQYARRTLRLTAFRPGCSHTFLSSSSNLRWWGSQGQLQ